MKKYFLILFLFIPVFSYGKVLITTPFESLKSGLVGYWTFDGKNITNGRVDDVSGNSNHGNTSGIATSTFYTAGKIGQGGRFDGVAISVNAGDPVTFDNTNTISVSAWVKADVANELGAFIAGKSTGLSGFNGWTLSRGSTEAYSFYVRSDGSTTATAISDSTFQDTKWHHIVGVYNGVDVRVYVDGVNADSTPPAFTAILPATTKPFCIGRSPGAPDACTGSGSMWKGLIDDVRVYNRALSAAEVKQLYNLGQAKINTSSTYPISDLLAYYTFDGSDMIGTVAKDASGNGNNGTIKLIATSTFYKIGKLGQAGNFDGVNDNILTNSDFISNNPVTISAWINPRSLGGGSVGRIVSNIKTIFYVGGTNQLNLRSDAVTTVSTGNNAFPLNNWTFVSVSRDANGVANFYINGIATGTPNQNSGTPTTGGTSVEIGDDNTIKTFNGLIDEVRVYKRVLTDSEILKLYNYNRFYVDASSAYPINSNLLAYYTFDGKNFIGGTASDISGNAYNGSPVNIASSTFYVSGKIGQAVNFDGVNDRINTGSEWVGSGALTIAAWVNPPSLGGGNLGRILANDKTIFSFVAGNSLRFTSDGAFTTASSAANSITLNKWQYVAVTRDSTGVANLYVNGQLSGTANQASGTPVGGSTNVRIGANNNGTNEFNGKMDNLRVYNRVLTQNEILQLYNGGF